MIMRQAQLFAPPEYWRLSEDERIWFRCGPGRGVLEWLVPDHILGVCITPACAVHDFCYSQGCTDKDKCDADVIFLNNMIRIIEAHNGIGFLQRMRLRRARIYYEAVSHFGGPAFWSGKNRPDEMG